MAKEEETITEISEEVVEKVEEVTPASTPPSESVQDAPSLASIQGSATDTFSSVSKWGGAALDRSQGAFSTFNEWRNQGTPLREGIKAARLRLNDAVSTGRAHYSMVKETVQDKVDTSRAHTEAMLSNLGIKYHGVTELRRKHPEVLVGGATLTVALPSFLGGRRAMVRNGFVALVWSAGFVYGLNWWEARGRKPGSPWGA